MKGPSASERVRLRLKEELQAREISQRALAQMLTRDTGEKWTQSRVGHVLNGHVELRVDDADAISRVAKIFLTEAVRDRGLEFYAEMTPTELKILERMRQRPNILHGVMWLLDMLPQSEPSTPVPKRPKRGRPLNAELRRERAP